MRSDVAVFIITHKRADKPLTYNLFKRARYSGKVYLVVDDKDEQLSEYRAKYKDRVLVFRKDDYKKNVDTHINKFEMNGAIFARNACIDFAQKMKLKYFFVCDDDLKKIYFKNPTTGKMVTKEASSNIERIFEHMVEYMETARQIAALAVADNGTFFGGINKTVEAGVKYTLTKMMLYRAEKPIKYESILFEDTATICNGYRIGKIGFSVMPVSVISQENGTTDGGCKELYEKMSYYVGDFMTLMCRPDAIRIIQNKSGELIGNAMQINLYPKIINENYKKACNE